MRRHDSIHDMGRGRRGPRWGPSLRAAADGAVAGGGRAHRSLQVCPAFTEVSGRNAAAIDARIKTIPTRATPRVASYELTHNC